MTAETTTETRTAVASGLAQCPALGVSAVGDTLYGGARSAPPLVKYKVSSNALSPKFERGKSPKLKEKTLNGKVDFVRRLAGTMVRGL